MNFIVERHAVVAVLLLLCCTLMRQDGLGCSLVMGYVQPTNFELVKGADAVVLARAESFEKKGKLGNGKAYGTFQFRALETLKEDCRNEFITVEGDTTIRSWGDPNDFSYPSTPAFPSTSPDVCPAS